MNIEYAKTVLYAFNNIDAVLGQIDELVEKRALTSMSDFSPCIFQAEKILELTSQKDILIYLKIKTEEVLAKFSKEERDYFDYKYFKIKPKDYYVNFDFSSRAYFRKQIKLARLFADRLERYGITDEYFKTECLKIEFFKELHKRVVEREKRESKTKSPQKGAEFALSEASGKGDYKKTA